MAARMTESSEKLINLLKAHQEPLEPFIRAARRAMEQGDHGRVRRIYDDACKAYPHLFGKEAGKPAGVRPPKPRAGGRPAAKQHEPPLELAITKQGGALSFGWSEPDQGRLHLVHRVGSLEWRSLPGRLDDIRQAAATMPGDEGQAGLLEEVRELGELVCHSLLPERIRELLDGVSQGVHLYLDPASAAVPWEFLWDGRDFLSLRFPLTRQLSLCRQKAKPDCRARNLLAVGDTDGGRLPLAGEEVRQVAGLYRKAGIPSDLAADDMSREGMVAQLFTHGMVHYAGHSDLGSGGYWQCADGRFDGRHIGLLAKVPRLVFANSCGSASLTGRSLARAFLDTGARNFLGPLWRVPDHRAMDFALAFHGSLLRGETIGRALFDARKSLPEDVGWAGYVAYSRPETRMTDLAG